MKTDISSLAEALVKEAGGPEKLSAEFLARLLERYDAAGDAGHANAVLHILADAARAGNFSLVTDTITATSLRLIPTFVGLLIQLEQESNFESVLDAIHREVPAEKSLILFSKVCSVFGSEWKHRPLLQCATITERLGEELLTRQGRDDLGGVVGTALLSKSKSLYVVGETEEAIEASDHAIWFFIRASFFGGSKETQEMLADACVHHGGLLVQENRLDDARFHISEAVELYIGLLSEGRGTGDKVVATFRSLEKLLTDSGYPDGAAICGRAAHNIAATMKEERTNP